MKTGNQSRALLVELLIVVLFFMLASTVLLRVFAAANAQSAQAGRLTEALNAAQNLADRLYAAADPEAELKAMDFAPEDGVLRREDGAFLLEVSLAREARASGAFLRGEVRVYSDGERLVSLPCSRYEEGQP